MASREMLHQVALLICFPLRSRYELSGSTTLWTAASVWLIGTHTCTHMRAHTVMHNRPLTGLLCYLHSCEQIEKYSLVTNKQLRERYGKPE